MNQSYSIVFIWLAYSTWNSLDSEVNLKLLVCLVRHGFPRTGSTLMRIVAWNLPKHPSEQFGVVDVETMKLSDTESLQFWYAPLFQCSRLARSNRFIIFGILEHFPLVLVVYLSWLWHVLVIFLLRIAPGIQGSEEYCLSSFFCIFSPLQSILSE